MSWQAVKWALNSAPFPRSDPVGRLVLACLAEHANTQGRNAYPQVFTIAYALDLSPEVVPRILKRLVGYGLISKDGVGPQGQSRWVLHVDQRRPNTSIDEFIERYREDRAARQARWRRRSGVDDSRSSNVEHPGSSTRDDSRSSTEHDVDDSRSESRRLSVVSETTLDRHVDDSKYPHNHPYNHPQPSVNRHPSASPRGARDDELPAPKPTSYTEGFEAAWRAYGRKGAKRVAFEEWRRAIKRADARTITEAIGPYIKSKPDPKFRKDFERWLKGDVWESAVVDDRSTSGGHQPYQSATDANIQRFLGEQPSGPEQRQLPGGAHD